MRSTSIPVRDIFGYSTTDSIGNTTYQSVETEFTSYSDYKSDIRKNPKSSDGWRSPSPYTASVTTADAGLLRYDCQSAATKTRYQGAGYAYPVTASAGTASDIPASMFNASLVKALLNLNGKKGALLESIAEMQGSVDTIGNGARKIANAIEQARRRNWRGVAKSLGVLPTNKRKFNDAADIWLEYHFGWVPIFQDCITAAAFLSDEEVHKRIRLKGSAYLETVSDNTVTNRRSAPDGSRFSYNQHVRTKTTSGVRTFLWYSPDMSALRNLASFGLLDVAGTAWAVLPMSFVIDWFLSVGDILTAQQASIGLTYRGGGQTAYVKCEVSVRGSEPMSIYPISIFTLEYPPLTSMYMNRTVFSSEPRVFIPTLENPLSLWRTITSTAMFGRFWKKP